MSRRGGTVGRGIGALAKSAVLVAGVPAAIARLWLIAPRTPPGRAFSPASVAAWLHLVLAVVVVVWAWATIALVRDVVVAVRHHDASSTNGWSRRWAAAIAGLFLLVTAGAAVAGGIAANHPGAAVARPPFADAQPRVGDLGRPVGAPECLADLAARSADGRSQWPDISRANLGRIQSDGARFVDPQLIRPGWCLALPGSTKTATASTTGTSRRPSRLVEAELVGLGVLGTAALASRLVAMRRLGGSDRPSGTRPLPPRPAVGHAEAALRPFGESLLVAWIEAALRCCSSAGRPPDVRLVRAGPDGVDVLLDPADLSAPSPMTASDNGAWWSLSADALDQPEAIAADAGRAVPWLVPVGDDGESVYLLAVAPGRSLIVDATPQHTSSVLRGIVDVLRCVPWADELEVELIGIDPPPSAERAFHLHASSPAALDALAVSPHRPSRAHPRWRREPLVVACGEQWEIPPGLTSKTGIVADRGVATERLVIGDDGHGVLEPYGIALVPPSPTTDQQRLVDLLLKDASATVHLVPRRPDPSPVDRPDAPVHLRILAGRPVLEGAAPVERERERMIELLVYLTLRGGSAPVDDVATALWAREEPTQLDARIARLVAATRAARSAGEPIIEATDVSLCLTDAISTDWARFCALTATSRAATPDVAISALTTALALVDEPTFCAPYPEYDWAVADGSAATVRSAIVDAAHHLVSLLLAGGDVRQAGSVAARAHVVDPLAEIVVRDLMVIRERTEGTAGAMATFEALERALDQLSGAEPSSETRALLRALTTAHR